MSLDLRSAALTVGRNSKSVAARFPTQVAIEALGEARTYAE